MVRTFRANEITLLTDHIESVVHRTFLAGHSALAAAVHGFAVDKTPVWVPNVYPKVPDHPSAKKTLGGETKASWRVFFGQPEYVHVADGEQPDPGGTATKLLAQNKLRRATRITDIWITNGRHHIELLEFGGYPTLGRTRKGQPNLSVRGRLIKIGNDIFSTQAPRGMARLALDYGRRHGLDIAGSAASLHLVSEGAR